jgi:phenylacetate-CoA ligase
MGRLFELQCWIGRAYREGASFHKHVCRLAQSSLYNRLQLAQYQNHHLRMMVRHCYANVPYYRDLFDGLKLKPDVIRTVADLDKLPLLEKSTINANYDKLISPKNRNILCRAGSTSGSSGTPTKLLRDFESINFERAAVWRHWRQAGDNGKRRITVRGDIIVPASQVEPPFWKYNPANRELLMSGYHLSIDNSRAYIRKILEFEPDILYCYPSTARLLAHFFRSNSVDYQFQAIFTSSESLDDTVRHEIESTFNCRAYDWYGQAERVAAIGQCTHGRYHIQEDYSIVEMVAGAHGQELVGTHLFNYAMPLLRYRTFDYVEPEIGYCECGSAFRIVGNILGRNYSYILTPEGYQISITNHIPRGVDNLIETQFRQENPGEVVLLVVTNGRFTEADKALLINNTLEHTSPKMRVSVREVDAIPRGANGKFVNIVNKIGATN